MKVLKKLALLACCIYFPVQVMAWGQLGHRIVGQVAESSTDFIRLKNDKEVFFNPNSFYDYIPQQNDIEDDYAGCDWERFIPKSIFWLKN